MRQTDTKESVIRESQHSKYLNASKQGTFKETPKQQTSKNQFLTETKQITQNRVIPTTASHKKTSSYINNQVADKPIAVFAR